MNRKQRHSIDRPDGSTMARNIGLALLATVMLVALPCHAGSEAVTGPGRPASANVNGAATLNAPVALATAAASATAAHASLTAPSRSPIATTAPAMTAAALEDTLRVFVDQQTAAFPGRVEISVGALDARTALAPCAAPEPFIPAGTRLWGRASLGVRCRDGARWSVLMPVQVRIYAPAMVSAKALAPGQSLNAEDYEMVETELTREAPGILTSPDEVAGQVLYRPINAGTALRREHFRARPVAAAGDQVTLIYSGAGFSVSSSGKVLNAAQEGQSVRVQVESGRILSGIARSNRTVEVRP